MTDTTPGERVSEFAPIARDNMRATRILGVPVSVVDMASAVAAIVGWTKAGVSNYVCVRDVHGVMLAQEDAEFLAIHEKAGLVTPDGMPLVWIARLREGKAVGRVCGADLVDALSSVSERQGLRHYFYGGKPGVAESMVAALQARYSGLNVVGTFSPPFGSLSKEADESITRDIVVARPNIVWVGLSTPKQELWMRDHVARIPGAALIGVGAAFDFHAGQIKRAPKWMQRSGAEWLHRLFSEPRRLWWRYLVLAPKFALRAIFSELLYRVTKFTSA
jgi:N-acetylglucosaminyldiphosphoundecaprenol N-acetyl-beta-D-mannosaminyltransferase